MAIETARLLLREWEPEDHDDHVRMHTDPDVTRYLSPPTRANAEGSWHRFTSHLEERGFGHWAVVHKEDSRFIGHIGLLDHDDWIATPYTVEVGWTLDKDYWGRGLATEGGRASLEYAFDHLDEERIICITDPHNAASRRVAEKLGMSLAGETQWHEHHVVWYEIGREEFRAAQQE